MVKACMVRVLDYLAQDSRQRQSCECSGEYLAGDAQSLPIEIGGGVVVDQNGGTHRLTR